MDKTIYLPKDFDFQVFCPDCGSQEKKEIDRIIIGSWLTTSYFCCFCGSTYHTEYLISREGAYI